MNRKWDAASKEIQQKCIDEVIARVEEIEGDQVGVIAAQDIIDIVTENLAPEIYNAGVRDAKKAVQERFQDIEVDLSTLEQNRSNANHIMPKPKLILINGFAAAGKSTIARMYIDRHSLAMLIEGDELIVNIGKWSENEEKARSLVFSLTKAMLRTYLSTGNDVVLPYLATAAQDIREFESIAAECDADFYEVALHTDRPDAIAKLLKRGTWGEAGQPGITGQELPTIEELANKMEAALKQRPGAKIISVKENDPESTYTQLMNYLSE